MGSFSWTKADTLTKVRNIVEGRPFKLLIPKEFGGGFIKDKYQGYGEIGHKADDSPLYDMYELLAFWNAGPSGIADKLLFDEDTCCIMKEIDKYTSKNRHFGINIGCYPQEIDKLKYPLKLVSASYNGTYEDCPGVSYGDPNQGWGALYDKDLPEWLAEKIDSWKAQEKVKTAETTPPQYPDAREGDIYFNPLFHDLWIVHLGHFIKINDGYEIDLDEPGGFIKVGHADSAKFLKTR